jgi:hypothetical protein
LPDTALEAVGWRYGCVPYVSATQLAAGLALGWLCPPGCPFSCYLPTVRQAFASRAGGTSTKKMPSLLMLLVGASYCAPPGPGLVSAEMDVAESPAFSHHFPFLGFRPNEDGGHLGHEVVVRSTRLEVSLALERGWPVVPVRRCLPESSQDGEGRQRPIPSSCSAASLLKTPSDLR